jgi:hypothetical protein
MTHEEKRKTTKTWKATVTEDLKIMKMDWKEAELDSREQDEVAEPCCQSAESTWNLEGLNTE